MSNEKTGAIDRYNKSVLVDMRKEMTRKIEALESEQTRLIEALNGGFTNEDFRRLNIVNQHLQVAASRRKGEWLKGDHPQCIIISKSKT